MLLEGDTTWVTPVICKRFMLSTRLIAFSFSFYMRPMLFHHDCSHPTLFNWNSIIRIMYSGVWLKSKYLHGLHVVKVLQVELLL